ncbi:hypothetical protein [Yoonia sp. MH D7]
MFDAIEEGPRAGFCWIFEKLGRGIFFKDAATIHEDDPVCD